MAIYVDNERIEWRGKRWCHLVADSLDELHLFAARIGLRRCWFQGRASFPHYDVTTDVRERALLIGAIAAGKTQMLVAARKLKAEQAVSTQALAMRDTARVATEETLPLFELQSQDT
jgi:hypothetical protein